MLWLPDAEETNILPGDRPRFGLVIVVAVLLIFLFALSFGSVLLVAM